MTQSMAEKKKEVKIKIKEKPANKTAEKVVSKKEEVSDTRSTGSGQAPSKSSGAKTMAELVKKSPLVVKTFRRGQIVEGIVIAANKHDVFVDVGGKSEGIISGEELTESRKSAQGLMLGDIVLASVVQSENDQGYLVLSLNRAQIEKIWRDVYASFEKETPLDVVVSDVTKSGLLCDLTPGSPAEEKVVGFVPFSHLDRENYLAGTKETTGRPFEQLLGQTLKVKVIELDRTQRRLVFSQRKLVDEKSVAKKKDVLANIKVGDKVKGKVTTILPFGLFLEVQPGVEGLVHISEISRERVNNISDLYATGNELEAIVIDVVPEEGRLGLSLKDLTPDPWELVSEKYPVGKKIKGKVSKIMQYGAFITIEPGLDGLVHVSETVGPMNIGDDTEAIVISCDPRGKRLGLSVRKVNEEEKKSASAKAKAD